MKKNTAGQIIGAQLVNATTGAAFTGSVTAYVTGDGGTQAVGSVGSGACTHEGNGFHTYAPAQAETNFDHIGFTFIGTGAVPATVQVYPQFPQTGDSFARLGAPAGASVSADAAAIKAETATILSDTNDIQTRIPAALVSGRIDASVGAMASGVLTATAIASDAITDAKVASDVTIASVTGAVGSVTGAVGSVTGNVGGNVTGSVGSVVGAVGSVTGNVGGNVTGSVGSVTGLTASDVGAIKVTTDRLATTLEAGAGSPGEFRFSADSLVNAPNSTGPSAAAIADAVWDEPISGHLTGGTTGAALNAAGSAGDPWSAPLPGAYSAGTAGFIVADILGVTDKLDTTLMSASGSPGEYQFTADALELAPAGTGGGGSAPSAAAVAAAVWAEALPGGYSAGQAGKIVGDNINATISSRATQTSVDTIDGIVDAVLIDTAEIGAAGAGLTAIASAVNLATLAGYVDTEVAAIKAKTDNLPASPAAVSDIPTAGAVADAVWDEALSGHTTAGTGGAALRDADLRGSRTICRGTVGTGTTPSTTQFTPSALTPAGASADQFKGRIILFDIDTATAALRGEATDITASSNATLPLLTFTALSATPSSGDTFSIA